jgi:hypothetical protein
MQHSPGQEQFVSDMRLGEYWLCSQLTRGCLHGIRVDPRESAAHRNRRVALPPRLG